MNEPDPALIRAYVETAARIAQFEYACARALDDASVAPIHRRDLCDRADALAERAKRHASALRASDASPLALARADRLFLAEFGAALDENCRFIDRRLGAGLLPDLEEGRSAVEADKAFRKLSSEYAPSAGAADALGFVALRLAELENEASRASAEGERRLERDFLAVKLKSFLERIRHAEALNPELLWKCRMALERRAASEGPVIIAAEAPGPGIVALMPGAQGDLDIELQDRGLRLRMEFRPDPRGGSVEGYVETGGESAPFSLKPPQQPLRGTKPMSFADFLVAYDLKTLFEAWTAKAAKIQAATAPSEAASAAARISAALDNLI